MSRDRIDTFFTSFLSIRGAIVEPFPDGLRALLDPELARRLGTP